ncbi:MAG: protein kinase [Polyangiaceae bacterium]|nr:protein kinase [Polyangiaceae bacterium]
MSEVGGLIDDVLTGLVAAHAAGVIHRDLKPGNIFVERTGDPKRPERAKILDFGISKIASHKKEEPTLTAFDATLGSFAYMAPEQIRGAARADERADIYAVAPWPSAPSRAGCRSEGSSAAILVSLKLERQRALRWRGDGRGSGPRGRAVLVARAAPVRSVLHGAGGARGVALHPAVEHHEGEAAALAPTVDPGGAPAGERADVHRLRRGFAEDHPTEVDDNPPTMTG